MAVSRFPLPYLFDVERDDEFSTKTVVFENNKKQVQQSAILPVTTWKINVKGTPAQLQELLSFFNNVGGNTRTFAFTDEFGNDQTVRFADKKLSIKEKRDFNKGSSTNGFVVGFEATITLEGSI